MKAILMALSAVSLLTACTDYLNDEKSSKAAKTEAKKEVVKEEPKQEVEFTVEDALSAMVRGHPNSKKVCYDRKLNGYLIYYRPPLKAGDTPEEGKYYGWLYIDKVRFYQSANNTWFIAEQNNHIAVYPDDTGLPCKDTPPL